MEEAEAPFRCRLQKDGLKFSRDISKWEARAPLKRKSNKGSEEAGDEFTSSENERCSGGSGGGGSDVGGERGTECGGGASFFAFPLVVHNSHAHHVVRIAQNLDRYSPNNLILVAEKGYSVKQVLRILGTGRPGGAQLPRGGRSPDCTIRVPLRTKLHPTKRYCGTFEGLGIIRV